MQVSRLELKNRRSDCPVSCWLDIFGNKWTLLILRDSVLFGKRYFKEFANSGEGIASNILSDRLQKLVEAGLLQRKDDEHNRLKIRYEPTDRASELAPILLSIAEWSVKNVQDTYSQEDLASLAQK